jgi:hypothetical protein
VVSASDYRITFTETDGRRWTTAPVPAARVRVTEGHKEEWRRQRARPVPSIRFGPNGERTAGFSARPVVEPYEWPEFLPHFLPSAVWFASDGHLWVQRTTAAGAPTTFDVIDAAGRLVQRVTLPVNTRLVGFGSAAVYLVRRDNDDLEYLQKYRLSP